MGIRLDFGVTYIIAVEVAEWLITSFHMSGVTAGCLIGATLVIALVLRLHSEHGGLRAGSRPLRAVASAGRSSKTRWSRAVGSARAR